MTVVVTGVGAVTALGRTARETFDRVLTGERGFSNVTLFDPGETRTRIVAEVPHLATPADPEASRTSELALIAAREAIAQAGLDVRTRRVGLVLGGSTAGMFETESTLATLLSTESERMRDGASQAREAALAKMLSHPLSAPTDRLARELGPFVRTRSLSSACSSGANALLVGATWLTLGLVDAVVCGAADALCRVTMSGFNALAALDPDGARPFDARRRGLTLGEGAGMLVLERRGDARGAASREGVLCTLLGWASRSEANHITNPEPTGRAPLAAMIAALARAGLSPSDIDYVNAHGTGTVLNDVMESRALAALFGEGLSRVAVSSQKGMLGHTLAAGGAIEAVLTALAIERGMLPPTGGLEEPDPACALHHVRAATPRAIGAAISSSFGFGGMDTALVLGRADCTAPPAPRPRPVFITGLAVVTPAGVFAGTEIADVPSRVATSEDAPLPPLDPERARRLDRTARIAVTAVERAMEPGAVDAGVVLGIAFGAVDATAEYMRRLRDKGARLVRPADFPGLVPSSPAGHVSIYLGLTGPAFVVADLAVSGECAIAQASELIAAGEAEQICAGAVEERSAIVEEVRAVVFGGDPTVSPTPRREGGVAIALASSDARAIARLGDVHVWLDRGSAREGARDDLAALGEPPEGAIVVLGGVGDRALEIVQSSRWSACPRVRCVEACGVHEAVGGIAIAVAAAKVARGDASAALYVGSARGWGYAGVVWPPNANSPADPVAEAREGRDT